MTLFVLLLTAVATTGAPQCVSGNEATRLLDAMRETPTPLGMILGTGSDWGAKYLVVRTTHRLGVPGIPARAGAETITYYAATRERTCFKEIRPAACPRLDLAIGAYRGRSYGVMHNRSAPRGGAAYHPSFALLHAQDGDGNTIRVASAWTGHPLLHDATETFSGIASCTKDVDELAGGF